MGGGNIEDCHDKDEERGSKPFVCKKTVVG